jgi:hypothetical protein
MVYNYEEDKIKNKYFKHREDYNKNFYITMRRLEQEYNKVPTEGLPG